MTKPVISAVLISFLSLPAWADSESYTLVQLSKGEAGRLTLVTQAEVRPMETRLDSIGIRGEYRNGHLLWIDHRQDGGTVVGMGYKVRF